MHTGARASRKQEGSHGPVGLVSRYAALHDMQTKRDTVPDLIAKHPPGLKQSGPAELEEDRYKKSSTALPGLVGLISYGQDDRFLTKRWQDDARSSSAAVYGTGKEARHVPRSRHDDKSWTDVGPEPSGIPDWRSDGPGHAVLVERTTLPEAQYGNHKPYQPSVHSQATIPCGEEEAQVSSARVYRSAASVRKSPTMTRKHSEQVQPTTVPSTDEWTGRPKSQSLHPVPMETYSTSSKPMTRKKNQTLPHRGQGFAGAERRWAAQQHPLPDEPSYGSHPHKQPVELPYDLKKKPTRSAHTNCTPTDTSSSETPTSIYGLSSGPLLRRQGGGETTNPYSRLPTEDYRATEPLTEMGQGSELYTAYKPSEKPLNEDKERIMPYMQITRGQGNAKDEPIEPYSKFQPRKATGEGSSDSSDYESVTSAPGEADKVLGWGGLQRKTQEGDDVPAYVEQRQETAESPDDTQSSLGGAGKADDTYLELLNEGLPACGMCGKYGCACQSLGSGEVPPPPPTPDGGFSPSPSSLQYPDPPVDYEALPPPAPDIPPPPLDDDTLAWIDQQDVFESNEDAMQNPTLLPPPPPTLPPPLEDDEESISNQFLPAANSPIPSPQLVTRSSEYLSEQDQEAGYIVILPPRRASPVPPTRMSPQPALYESIDNTRHQHWPPQRAVTVPVASQSVYGERAKSPQLNLPRSSPVLPRRGTNI